ncbi:MAG: hypothetical protein II850_04485 [Fibrobacter sp.]|nr:hypothetical protein [Fibrobacter sp.]
MNNLTLTFMGVLSFLWIACTDSEPSNSAGATTEPNSIAQNSSSSENVIDNRAKILESLDSILIEFQSHNYDSTTINDSLQKDSSKVPYTFSSTKERFYEDKCFINIFESESAVQYIHGENEGNSISISIVYQEEGVLLRTERNTYWNGSKRDEELTRFQTECAIKNGLFKEYHEKLAAIQHIACAITIESKPLRETLATEAEIYKQHCIEFNEKHPEEDSCTITCSGGGGRESHCDTLCPK